MKERKKILILGGGPSGLAETKALKKKAGSAFEIILVDQNESFNFLPRLFQKPYPIPYRQIANLLNINFAHAEVVRVDSIARTVFLKSKISNAIKTVPYDFLIFALGGEGNFYQIPGLEKYCYNLYDTSSAAVFAKNLISIFQKNKNSIDPFNIVVGGGGAVGVETSLTLANFFRGQNWDFLTGEGKIYLYESGQEILSEWPLKMKKYLRQKIHAEKIELRTKKVIAETIGDLVGEKKESFLLWAGGKRGNPLFEQIAGVKLDNANFIIANDFLELNAHPEIKIIKGDNLRESIADAKIIASNFYREARFLEKRKKEKRKPKVFVFPLGDKDAATQIGGILLTGYFGWLAYRVITLYYLISILPIKLAWECWKKIN